MFLIKLYMQFMNMQMYWIVEQKIIVKLHVIGGRPRSEENARI
jgi:hypothetical protein